MNNDGGVGTAVKHSAHSVCHGTLPESIPSNETSRGLLPQGTHAPLSGRYRFHKIQEVSCKKFPQEHMRRRGYIHAIFTIYDISQKLGAKNKIVRCTHCDTFIVTHGDTFRNVMMDTHINSERMFWQSVYKQLGSGQRSKHLDHYRLVHLQHQFNKNIYNTQYIHLNLWTTYKHFIYHK